MDSITYSFSIFWIGIAALAAWILITYTLLLVMSIVCIGFIGVDNPATPAWLDRTYNFRWICSAIAAFSLTWLIFA